MYCKSGVLGIQMHNAALVRSLGSPSNLSLCGMGIDAVMPPPFGWYAMAGRGIMKLGMQRVSNLSSSI
jgi:hypothetical protein